MLVGPSDSGKTFWAKNTLIPYLETSGKKVEYLKDGSELPKELLNVVICDEVEILFDQEYLQGNSAEKYYTDEYLNKVRGWYKSYSQLPMSTLFITTRNEPNQIDNLLQNFHKADWDNRDIVVLKFEK